MTITVPAERVDEARDEVRQRLAKRLKLPGFRKGKVPAHVVEKRYGPSIDQEALERLVGSAYREALEEKGFEPISQAQVGSIDYSPGTDLTFQVQFDVRPEIEISRVEGFTAKREVAEVTDQEVDRVLQRLREDQAVWREMEEGAPGDGDLAVVEISELAADGEAGEPRRYQVVLGEDQVLPEIEEELRRLTPGQEAERTVQIHQEADSGPIETERRVRIRLVEAKRPELPAIDDDFAASVGDFKDLAELRERVREDLVQEAEREGERDLRRQLIDQLLEANPFDVPDSMVQRYLEGMLPSQEGADPERVEQIREQARPAAERAIKRMLAIDHLAEANGLRATPEEVDARVAEIAERNERSPAEVRAQLQKSGRLGSIEEEITETRFFDWLKASSKIG